MFALLLCAEAIYGGRRTKQAPLFGRHNCEWYSVSHGSLSLLIAGSGDALSWCCRGEKDSGSEVARKRLK